jgi:hypothetical protein
MPSFGNGLRPFPSLPGVVCSAPSPTPASFKLRIGWEFHYKAASWWAIPGGAYRVYKHPAQLRERIAEIGG